LATCRRIESRYLPNGLGFSAGGNFTYTAAFRLHEELKKLEAEGKLIDAEMGKPASPVSFYPAVDWTKTRAQRNASNPNFTPVFDGLFDQSYLSPKSNMYLPLLSPGLAPDQLLKEVLPQNMVMITCWDDGLLVEDEKLRGRLKVLGKRVDGYMVEGVVHGWDKWRS
jgi:acetyl esterase/lipase